MPKIKEENETSNQAIFKSLIDIYQHDGKEAWNTFIAFLIAQSIIFAFAGKSLLDLDTNQKATNIQIIIFYGSTILGLLTSIMIFLIYKRFSKYNEFRIGQMKANEPDGWNIMKGNGEKFAKGEPIELKYTVDGEEKSETYKISRLYRIRAKHLIPSLMMIFIIAYLGLIVLSFFVICFGA